jgi:hypothetical protein
MLRPTAPNKMYNAILTYSNFGGKLAESTIAPVELDDIFYNNVLLDKIVGGAKARFVQLAGTHPDGKYHKLDANVVELTPASVVQLLKGYRWYGSERGGHRDSNPMQLQIEFLSKHGQEDPAIDDWILLGPFIAKPYALRSLAGKDFHVVYRSRRDGEKFRFNTYNDPIHRRFAEHIAGQAPLRDANNDLSLLRRPRRGVIIYYPITEVKKDKAPQPFTVGLTLLFPPNGISSPPQFSVRRPDLKDAPVVTVAGE